MAGFVTVTETQVLYTDFFLIFFAYSSPRFVPRSGTLFQEVWLPFKVTLFFALGLRILSLEVYLAQTKLGSVGL